MTTEWKQKSITYEKKSASRIKKADEGAIADILNELSVDNGVNPEMVLNEARDPKSVLHKYFTWDDQSAAHKHRLAEAGLIIRSYNMRVEYVQVLPSKSKQEPQRKEIVTRMLQSVRRGDNTFVYKQVAQVLGSPEEKNQAIQQLYTYLLSAVNKFHAFVELAEEISDLTPILVSLAKRLGKDEVEINKQIQRIKKGH